MDSFVVLASLAGSLVGVASFYHQFKSSGESSDRRLLLEGCVVAVGVLAVLLVTKEVLEFAISHLSRATWLVGTSIVALNAAAIALGRADHKYRYQLMGSCVALALVIGVVAWTLLSTPLRNDLRVDVRLRDGLVECGGSNRVLPRGEEVPRLLVSYVCQQEQAPGVWADIGIAEATECEECSETEFGRVTVTCRSLAFSGARVRAQVDGLLTDGNGVTRDVRNIVSEPVEC